MRAGLAQARGELLSTRNLARTSAQDLTLFLVYALAYPTWSSRRIGRPESRGRRIGSLLYTLECRALFDLSYWDVNGTPKVFPRKFEQLLTLPRDDT